MTLSMGLSTLSVVTSILVLYFHHRRGTSRLPPWLQFLAFGIVARVLCMQRDGGSRDSEQRSQPGLRMRKLLDVPRQPEAVMPLRESLERRRPVSTDSASHQQEGPAVEMTPTATAFVTLLSSVCRQLADIRRELRQLTERIRARDDEQEIADDWKDFARVLDRFFFWIAFVVVVVAIVWLAVHTQNIREGFDD